MSSTKRRILLTTEFVDSKSNFQEVKSILFEVGNIIFITLQWIISAISEVSEIKFSIYRFFTLKLVCKFLIFNIFQHLQIYTEGFLWIRKLEGIFCSTVSVLTTKIVSDLFFIELPYFLVNLYSLYSLLLYFSFISALDY